MIKIRIRRNLLYPCLFIFFTLIRRIIKIIIDEILLEGVKTSFIIIWLMVFFELIISNIYVYNQAKKDKNENKENNKNKNNKELNLIQNRQRQLILPDKGIKIITLIIFAGYFEFIGFLSRRFITIYDSNDNYDEFNAKFRSIEIYTSSILCKYTLRIKIFKHHIFSIIIIVICLFLVFIFELLIEKEEMKKFWMNISYVCITSLFRAFLDTTEKYLFDYDFVNVFKLMRLEEFLNIFLISLFFIFPTPYSQIVGIIEFGKKKNNLIKAISGIILLLIYATFSAYKNIYRRYTVKKYSPMSRALAESVLDPIFIIWGFVENRTDWYYFTGIMLCSFIIIFCSLVYNEAIILYFCGLEYNTFFGINDRGEFYDNLNKELEINFTDNDNKENNIEENDKDIDKNRKSIN